MINPLVSNGAARLKKIRLYLGMTREQFGEILEISQYTIRSWENGRKPFVDKSIKRVVDSLKKNLNFDCDPEWLKKGQGVSPILLSEKKSTKIPLAYNDENNDNIIKEVHFLKENNKDIEVIQVTDNNILPLASQGDYIGLKEIKDGDFTDILGRIVYFVSDDKNGIGVVSINTAHKKYIVKPLSIQGNVILGDEADFYDIVWYRKND